MALLFLGACGGPSYEVLPLGDNLSLVQADGRPFSLSEVRGKPGLVFFGYSHCPDWCPSTLSRLVRVKSLLGKRSNNVWMAFVSVDTERDKGEVLAGFLKPFDLGMIGLTGTDAQIDQCLKAWGSYRERQVRDDGRGISWDHGTQIYLVDPQGRARALFTAKDRPEDIARALKDFD